jgi:FixJ family two-component response regulator
VSARSVLFVDDDSDLREVLGELLESEGATCLSVGSVHELVALGPKALGCDLAILDVNLGPGQPSGLNARSWLLDNAFRGRVVFLTGHSHTFPGLSEARALGVDVFEKPASVELILELLGGRADAAVTR